MATTAAERIERLYQLVTGDARQVFAWLTAEEAIVPPDWVPAYEDRGGEMVPVTLGRAELTDIKRV